MKSDSPATKAVTGVAQAYKENGGTHPMVTTYMDKASQLAQAGDQAAREGKDAVADSNYHSAKIAMQVASTDNQSSSVAGSMHAADYPDKENCLSGKCGGFEPLRAATALGDAEAHHHFAGMRQPGE
jgi:hypothetical protein